MKIQSVPLIKYSPYFFSVICLTIFLSVVNLAQADINLSFGLYTSDKPTTLVKKFRPILDSLESSMSSSLNTRVSIKLSITKSYEHGILSIANGGVDFSRLGPASFIAALEHNPNISLLAMETKKGKKRFNGVICVHKNSPINNIVELKGKRFAFGNKQSTIGRYLSQRYLLNQGIKAKDLAKYDYLGRHDKVGYAVARKQYDAGALKESTYKKLLKKDLPLRKVASFENVTKPWVASSTLNIKIKNALSDALLSIKNKEVLKAIKKDGFTKGSIEDYKITRHAIKTNNEFFSK